MSHSTYRIYEVVCATCERSFLTTTSQSVWYSAKCGYCVMKGKLERLEHPEDRAEARMNCSRWLGQQAAWLRIYSEQEVLELRRDGDGIAAIHTEGFETDDPF